MSKIESEINHLIEIDLPNSYKDSTNFDCELFRLIRKADRNNRIKLKRAFPVKYEAWERFERIGLCKDWEELPEIGGIVTIGNPCFGVPGGSLGVIYEQYDLSDDDISGVGIIFSNGVYDGFSKNDLKEFSINYSGKVDRIIKHYQFSTVIQIEQDFKDGVFNDVLGLDQD